MFFQEIHNPARVGDFEHKIGQGPRLEGCAAGQVADLAAG
jgi:hypothetical protein